MRTIYVAKNGTISSIQQALELVENEPTTILLDEGIYFEKFCVHSDNIILKGKSKDNTIISFNDFSTKIHQDKMEYNTFRTYTSMIIGNNITLENLTIENSAGPSEKFAQAVALHLLGDKIIIRNSIIKGHQDTIFSGPLPLDLQKRYLGFISDCELVTNPVARHYFEHCTIYGDVDFIFGSGNALFFECQIVSVGTKGYIAAPSTEKNQNHGITFINCELVNGGSAKNIFLARPWRDYGACTFINCHYDNHINKEMFDKWNNTSRNQTCRFNYYNIPVDYQKTVVTWANKLDDIANYSIEKIFNGWIPK